jgi:5-formyltetrahydrofolate cyclo-ligase
MIKEKIRQEIKNKLNKLSPEECLRQSDFILQKLESLPDFSLANTILLYWSLPKEVHTQNFIEKWANKKTILLPVVVGNELILKKFTKKEDMNWCKS